MRFALRDAAVGYASRGIPVLPLHYPVSRPQAARPLSAGRPGRLGWPVGCSCRDPGCGQIGKHPLGALAPHGLREATTNRARVLAWWTRYPQANIGLACGYRLDALDLDGPEAVAALRSFLDRHGVNLPAGGPVVRTGRAEAGWHYYLAPAGLGRRTGVLERVDYQGRGAYVVAPPSRHASGQPYRWVRDLDHPLPPLPERLRAELERPPPLPPAVPVLVGQPPVEGPGPAYVRSALATELARVATAPVGRRNHQLWESGRNLFNFVAAGALDQAEVERGLLQAAERNGLLTEEPSQTHRTLASARQVGLDHPRRPPERLSPDRTPPRPLPVLPRREDGERAQGNGGDALGHRRSSDRLTCSRGGRVPPPSRAHAHPDHPQEGACMGSPPTLDPTRSRPLDLDRPDQDRHLQERHPELLEHLQTPAALGGHEFQEWPPHQIANGFGGDLDARHRHDHTRLPTDFTHTHPQFSRDAVREGERAFDRLNPDYGVPADQRSHYGRQAVREREAALALGVRTAVHDSRQNDPNPVIWQPGQDYRMADALQAARTQPTRAHWGPERTGPER